MIFLVILLGFAAFNSLWVPLKLEQESLDHPRAKMAIEAGKYLAQGSNHNLLSAGPSSCQFLNEVLNSHDPINICPATVEDYVTIYSENFISIPGCCPKMQNIEWALNKHAKELGRMKVNPLSLSERSVLWFRILIIEE